MSNVDIKPLTSFLDIDLEVKTKEITACAFTPVIPKELVPATLQVKAALDMGALDKAGQPFSADVTYGFMLRNLKGAQRDFVKAVEANNKPARPAVLSVCPMEALLEPKPKT